MVRFGKDDNDDIKRNPETSLELIEEFLQHTGPKRSSMLDSGELKEISDIADPSEGDLYMVTLQSVRTDTHMTRAHTPEEAMHKAAELSDNDEIQAFHRRFETLDPMVFKIPSIEDMTPDEDGTPMIGKEERIVKTERPRTPHHHIEDDDLMSEIQKYIKEKAEEYD